MTPPEAQTIAVAIARLDEKLSAVEKTLVEHGRFLEDLKSRRWPLSVVSALGAAGVVYGIVHGGH